MLNNADYTASTGLHELDQTDQEYNCAEDLYYGVAIGDVSEVFTAVLAAT